MYGLRGPRDLNMVNQAFRIKIAYRSKKEEEEKKEKIPGIGRYPMGPTKIDYGPLTFKGGSKCCFIQKDINLLLSHNMTLHPQSSEITMKTHQ